MIRSKYLVTLKTFRAGTETISTDPGARDDGDTTTWVYDLATGLELRKTYADGSHVNKTYDAFNRLTTETDARGNVKTHTYETARGLHLSTTYATVAGTSETSARHFCYNHLGQLTQVTDDSGTRTLGYNRYGEPETDSLAAGGVTHLITETRDDMGRSGGYTYAKNGNVQQTVTTGYGTDGRINAVGFLHKGAEKKFSYSYLPGSNLLQTLTLPCNMTLTQSYEEKRDLLTGMSYKRGTTGVAVRAYTYDSLGRPLTRRTARKGTTVNDTFAHNNSSELTEATVSGASYSYAHDKAPDGCKGDWTNRAAGLPRRGEGAMGRTRINIGNRTSAQEAAEEAQPAQLTPSTSTQAFRRENRKHSHRSSTLPEIIRKCRQAQIYGPPCHARIAAKSGQTHCSWQA